MSKKTWEVGDVVGCHWSDEVTVTAWWYTAQQRIVELSNAIAMPQQKWEEAGWRFVEKKQAMSEKRAWEVGDWLVRRRDGYRWTVIATRVRLHNDATVDMLVARLGEECIAAEQSILEADGWELLEGLEQR